MWKIYLTVLKNCSWHMSCKEQNRCSKSNLLWSFNRFLYSTRGSIVKATTQELAATRSWVNSYSSRSSNMYFISLCTSTRSLPPCLPLWQQSFWIWSNKYEFSTWAGQPRDLALCHVFKGGIGNANAYIFKHFWSTHTLKNFSQIVMESNSTFFTARMGFRLQLHDCIQSSCIL